MKERPILFSAPMVRAILDGTKTQTRRILKHSREIPMRAQIFPNRGDFVIEKWPRQEREFGNFGRCENIQCPLGQVGDRLWVRETWRPHEVLSPWDLEVEYAADGAKRLIEDGEFGDKDWRMPLAAERGFVPSIHMPRWASRITLEIVSVRVERLKDISEEDAKAEGVTRVRDGCHVVKGFDYDLSGLCHTHAVTPFMKLWESINGPGSWEANPWLWVVEFRRAESEVKG